jgi:hypothetical protein
MDRGFKRCALRFCGRPTDTFRSWLIFEIFSKLNQSYGLVCVCDRLIHCGRLDSPFRLLLVLSELLEVCAFPSVIKVITKLIDKASTVCLQCLEYSARLAHLFCIMAYIFCLNMRITTNVCHYFLLCLSNRCTMYVNNYLFPLTLLHVSVFIHNQQGVYM